MCYQLRCSLSGSSTLFFTTVPSLWVTMVAAPGNIQPRFPPPLSTLNEPCPCLCSFGVQWGTLLFFVVQSVKELFFSGGHARTRTCCTPLGADRNAQTIAQLSISCREREFFERFSWINADFFITLPSID